MHTPALDTSTSIASNNENGQEMKSSNITHAPDVTREGLTRINYTSPKYKVIIIDGMDMGPRECNTQDRKNRDMQIFLDQLYSTDISTSL